MATLGLCVNSIYNKHIPVLMHTEMLKTWNHALHFSKWGILHFEDGLYTMSPFEINKKF